MTTTPQAALLSALAEFNRYFASANGVDVSARISVPRDEWRALHAAILAKLQATQEPVQAEPALRDYANSLIKAGHDFWKACNREAGGGAVRWLSCDDGTLIVFTRGEYRDTIMENIGCYKAPEVFFEEDGITAAESKEPVQAGELPDEREAFEAWASNQSWFLPHMTRRRDMAGSQRLGQYIDPDMLAGWSAWQARAALAARKPLTRKQINEASRDAQVSFCLKVGGTYEDELARAVERAHGINGLEVKP